MRWAAWEGRRDAVALLLERDAHVNKAVGKRPTRQDWRYLCSLYADTLRWLALARLHASG